MTEFWKSQENHFCKYCKCWVNDNPISRQIHENGVRHKKSVEDKLSELRKKQITDAKQTKDESHWLKKMEEAALKDYKKKDIQNSRDFTAKLYNNEDLPDIEEKYESIRNIQVQGPTLPGEPQPKAMKYEKMLYGPSGAPKEEDQSKEFKIAPVKATSSGTKFHNPPPPKFWYEAKNEDGQSYYWNTNTKESRWDPPHSGYVSIAEQEELQQKKDEKRLKKAQIIERQREKFISKAVDPEPEKPSKPDAYGTGGWQSVKAPEAAPAVDLGLPEQSSNRLAPVIQAKPEKDRQMIFKEKTVASIGASMSSSSNVVKPAITFRKRKNQAIRPRDDDL